MRRDRKIIRDVAHDHGAHVAEIVGPSRVAHLVCARRDAIARLRGAGYSLRQIAKVLSRDFSTITHHCYPKIRAYRKAKAAARYRTQKASAA